jgi:hypothetical protein
MGTMEVAARERGERLRTRLLQAAAEVLIGAGLQALIASGIMITLCLGGLALVMHNLTVVPAAARGSFLLLPFVMAITSITTLGRRHHHLAVQQEAAVTAQARAAAVGVLVQQLRAVDLEMTALRCYGRTIPDQRPDEARRDCVRVVLRPVYNRLASGKRGEVSLAFHEWDEGRRQFRHVVAMPEFRLAAREVVASLDKDSAAGRALAEGEPNLIPDVTAPAARRRGWKALRLHRTSGSSLQVPVYRIGGRVDGEWLGVISADSDVVGAFTAADGDLLLEFAVKLNVIYEGMFGPDPSLHRLLTTP